VVGQESINQAVNDELVKSEEQEHESKKLRKEQVRKHGTVRCTKE